MTSIANQTPIPKPAPTAEIPPTPVPRPRLSPLQQKLNQYVAVLIPLIELGAVAFVTWVIPYQIATQYLMNPSEDIRQNFHVLPRISSGIAIIVVYSLLLVCLLVPWMRLFQIVWSKTDELPLGDPSRDKSRTSTKGITKYEAYICDYDGLPLWCAQCHSYKPDRAHHVKELGRCYRKFDHFCPWAGGTISESSHKFFLQFVFAGTCYTVFDLVVLAYYLNDRVAKTNAKPGSWFGAMGVTIFFFLFTFSMTGMTAWNIMINFTSVEGIQRGGVSNVAFLISRISLPSETPPSTGVTLNKEQANSDLEPYPVLCTIERSSRRTYVVMQTRPFDHPWYTTKMMGFKETMGENIIDWFSPIKQSPIKKKSRHGEFEWAESVFEMARQYERDNPGTRIALLEGTR